MSPESFPVITEIPFEGSPSFVVKLRHVPLRKRLSPPRGSDQGCIWECEMAGGDMDRQATLGAVVFFDLLR